MFGWNVLQASVDGLTESGEVIVVFAVEDVAFDEFPQAFDQVQVGRIRRQELQPDVQRCSEVHHQSTALIASVVQHQRHGTLQSQCGNFVKQVAHRIRRYSPAGGDAYQLIRHRIPCPQNTVTFATGSTANEHSLRTPQATEKSALNKMSGIHKENVTLTAASQLQQRLQRIADEFFLSGCVFLNGFLRRQWDGGRTSPLQPQTFFKNRRV